MHVSLGCYSILDFGLLKYNIKLNKEMNMKRKTESSSSLSIKQRMIYSIDIYLADQYLLRWMDEERCELNRMFIFSDAYDDLTDIEQVCNDVVCYYTDKSFICSVICTPIYKERDHDTLYNMICGSNDRISVEIKVCIKSKG